MSPKSPKSGNENLAALLRRRRTELGLSRRDVAHRSGLSYPYVSQLETAYRLPSPRAAQALASALDISAGTLFDVLADLSPHPAHTPATPLAPTAGDGGTWIPNPAALATTGPPAAAPLAPSAPPTARLAPSAPPPLRAHTRVDRPPPGTTGSAVRAAVELLTTIDPGERLAALNEVQAAVVASLVPPERHTR